MEKYKLKTSIYYNEDGDSTFDYKWDSTYILRARKGQIAERYELTDELREEYSVYDKMWKYIWVFNKGHSWLLTQDKNCDYFEKVVEE